MNAFQQSIIEAPAGVTTVQTSEGLYDFLDPACAAAIWARLLPQETLTWLADLDPACLPSGRVVVRAEDVAEAAQDLCAASGMPAGPHRDWFVQDITALAGRFADVMEADYLRVRLEAVTTNACRKFHLDALTGRLVCTYRGTGTQYGTSDGCCDPEQILTVPTGAPILLRGSLWPAQPSSGLVHRSPPIEGSGETRIVLVLDPMKEPEGAE